MLFNKRDYKAAERLWSPNYIQHSAHIEPGRQGLFDLIESLPDTQRYEQGMMMAEGDFVIVHGRFSGNGRPAAFIAVAACPCSVRAFPLNRISHQPQAEQ